MKVAHLSDSSWPHGLHSPWNSPGQNTRVGSFSLLQGIFPTKRLNPGLPHRRWMLYQLSHKGSPGKERLVYKKVLICLKLQCKIDAGSRDTKPVLWDNQRDGVGMGSRGSRWGDTCAPVADPCQCMARTITIL